MNNEDIRKYHYVLLYTENYVNIISEISALLIKNNLLSDNPSNFVKVSEKNAYYNDSNHNKITNRTIDKKITKKN
ncbi:MAG: hypothetical protein KatS3mg002_1241 [Candidatus Woesearchaeota archaeon]|nr:MAG: hypothetical protein KatS3mg002_1241 [Candidatus Woesearchaeota archaeon]